jgi:type III pantothenate kinase
MLLAVDVGNTQTVIGLYDLTGGSASGRRPEDGLLDHWRISTASDRTSDEFAVLLQGFLALRRNSFADLEGIVVSSGVPRVTATLREIADRHLDFEPIVIEPGVRTGIRIEYDNPKEVGADRIVNTIAAHHLFGGPCIVVDFGTSTNLDVVSAKGEFLGGALAPGIEISLDALAQRAAQLRKVELVRPRSAIGKNTVEALQSGALYGFAGQVDGLVDRICAELGEVTSVVATGGLAPIVVPESRTITHYEPDLTLIGLRLVFEKNVV